MFSISRTISCPSISWFNLKKSFHSGSCLFGWRDKFVFPEDAKKRPSDLEIAKKDLPKNTPTLGERVLRDAYSPFYQMTKKSGYTKGRFGDTIKDHWDGYTIRQVLQEADSEVIQQIKMAFKEALIDPRANVPKRGETRIDYKFDNDEILKQFKTTCDSDWGEGYSSCSFKRSPSGKAVFSGELSTRVPQDGRLRKAGYCNLSSLKKFRSFWRTQDLMWDFFTDLVFRVRGDGRTWNINIHTDVDIDVHWNDTYTYKLYTRGGPYWQYVKIPLSKFLLISGGWVQDTQFRCKYDKVESISFTLKDNVDGPFSLELDFIGLFCGDTFVKEEFAYETYVFPRKNYLS